MHCYNIVMLAISIHYTNTIPNPYPGANPNLTVDVLKACDACADRYD